jgi:hypothetical protein
MAQIKNGQFITLTTSEVAYSIVGDSNSDIETLAITLVSGTCQATVAPTTAAPILDNTYTTWSTAGDKIILSLDPGLSTLRVKCASAGVINVNW